jgi:hypothetical protein
MFTHLPTRSNRYFKDSPTYSHAKIQATTAQSKAAKQSKFQRNLELECMA